MVGKVKILKLYLLLLPLLFGGCIKEYLEKCPVTADNVRLSFVYTGDGAEDIFLDVMNGVSVYVYDPEGRKVAEKTLDRQALEKERAVSLTLDAGEYRVVCWGNISDNSEVSGAEDYAAAVVHHPFYASGGRIPTNDHLYHTVCETLVVPADGATATETLEFRSAHIDLEIYVKGENVGQQSLPVVEVANLYSEYDFAMNPTMRQLASGYNTATYYPVCSYDAGKGCAAAMLSVMRFASDDPVEIVLREEDKGEPIHVLAVKDFISSNGIRVEDLQECRLTVQITFNRDLSVDITIPEWETPDVKPEL